MAFRVGQKVTRKEQGEFAATNGESVPLFGIVYTIRDIVPSLKYPGEASLRFVEIVNQPHVYRDGFGEACFPARRFRPLVEKKTNIEVFKAMLTKAPQKESIDA